MTNSRFTGHVQGGVNGRRMVETEIPLSATDFISWRWQVEASSRRCRPTIPGEMEG